MNSNPFFNLRLEEAALNAWPPRQQLLLDGWIVRFAGGYTRRANSITPLYPAHRPHLEKIAFCEQIYGLRGLPAIFRLTDLAPDSSLEALLIQRGYQFQDRSLVLARQLEPDLLLDPALLRQDNLDTWLAVYERLNAGNSHTNLSHRALLDRIAARRLFAWLPDNDQPAACALGVLEGELFGMFNLLVEPSLRRRGLATRLVRAMLGWALAQGARYAYLQVMAHNEPAHQLYTSLGFNPCYAYWYRVQPVD